jgi:hypothetical protein
MKLLPDSYCRGLVSEADTHLALIYVSIAGIIRSQTQSVAPARSPFSIVGIATEYFWRLKGEISKSVEFELQR